MKKTASFCFILIIVLIFFSGAAFAAPLYEEEVVSNAVMLLDSTTGNVLFEKNADDRIRPASTTKILTCIIALENSSMNEIVKIGREGDWTGSGYSLLGTKNGEEIIMKDLLYGFMLVSGNDAAAAIAVHIGGSEEAFARMMNDKAAEIGMSSSHFVNPHGTDEDNHYVTARDMSRLVLYAVQNEQFMELAGTSSYDMSATNKNAARTVKNTNLLIQSDKTEYYSYATGVKTGSTPKAFRCLVSTAKKEDTELICLIFGDETNEGTERWPLAKSLFEYGFANFRTVNVQNLIDNEAILNIQVMDADSSDEQNGLLELEAHNLSSEFKTLDKSLADSITQAGEGLVSMIELYSGDSLRAPIAKGESVGVVTYRSETTGEIVCQGELIARRDIEKQNEPTFDSHGNEIIYNKETGEIETVKTGIVGLAWLWIALFLLLVIIIVLLVVSLIRGGRR